MIGNLDHDWLAALTAGTKVMFWTCLNDGHKNVTWTGDVATCDTCGLTSEMTARFARQVQEYERERIRQLALHKRAVYCIACDGAPCGYDDILRPFADLLTGDDPDSLTDPALD